MTWVKPSITFRQRLARVVFPRQSTLLNKVLQALTTAVIPEVLEELLTKAIETYDPKLKGLVILAMKYDHERSYLTVTIGHSSLKPLDDGEILPMLHVTNADLVKSVDVE